MDLNVFEQLSKCKDEDVTEVFLKEITEIYAHDKTEIIDYLKEETRRLLKDLRDKLATEVCHVLKDYDGKLLYQRRKSETFADDIYHLGFSLLNKNPHVNLRKIFRKTNPEEEDILQEPNQVKPESPLNSVEVLETVAVLKEQIGELTTTVRDLRKRVESLENVLTENQICELTMNNKITVNEDAPKKSSDEVIMVAQVETSPAETLNDIVMPPEQDNTDNEGFQHTQKQRKSIQQGKAVSNNLNQKQLIGKSKDNHSIKAAGQGRVLHPSAPILIYVGRLAKDTDEQSVRQHLKNIGVKQIADVVNLKCRNANESSFCISVLSHKEE